MDLQKPIKLLKEIGSTPFLPYYNVATIIILPIKLIGRIYLGNIE